MSTNFFASHVPGRHRGGPAPPDTAAAGDRELSQAAAGADLDAFEDQQALLIAAVRRAGGAPVSYDQLRDAGIEFPAGVVFELELAGIPLDRCHLRAEDGRRVAAVKLEPSRDPGGAAPTGDDAPAAATFRRRDTARDDGPAGRPAVRWLAPLALLAAAALVVAVLWISLAGNATHAPRPPARHHRRATAAARVENRPLASGQAARLSPSTPVSTTSTAAASTTSTAAASTTSTAAVSTTSTAAVSTTSTTESPTPAELPTSSSTPTPVSEARAYQLEAQGHTLLANGSYGQAISVLRSAVAATGEHLSTCLQPTTQSCLTYAYALYDLGRALRLNGDPSQAVPILRDRLEIDNQRPVVQSELQLALEQTH